MNDESSDTPSQPPRASRFREHTNTSNSIHPPPDELWKDLGIDSLIDKFNEDNAAPPATSRTSTGNSAPELRRLHSDNIKKRKERSTSASEDAQPQPTAPSASTLGRFQRVWASMLGGVLGKRKAGAVDAEKDKAQQRMDDRKKAAEAAYHEAKELGLLPTPKVFVRPGMAPITHTCGTPSHLDRQVENGLILRIAATPARSPRTPSLYRSPSKKDLQKQKKLSKRVSNLESKLASARKELYSVLNSDLPPIPSPPSLAAPLPATDQASHEQALAPLPTPSSPPAPVSETASESEEEETGCPPRSLGKVPRKRKVRLSSYDADYIPTTTDSEGDADMLSATSDAGAGANPDPDPDTDADELSLCLDHERTIKRVKSSTSSSSLRRTSARKPAPHAHKRSGRTSLTRHDVTVSIVPDGVRVPHVPAIPGGPRAKKMVSFEDDGGNSNGNGNGKIDLYGGLEHEMF